jgi:hypothetical protein
VIICGLHSNVIVHSELSLEFSIVFVCSDFVVYVLIAPLRMKQLEFAGLNELVVYVFIWLYHLAYKDYAIYFTLCQAYT